MKLILQAIKSLFRNVHDAIRDLKSDVEKAQTVAKNANKKAVEAKNTADKTSNALDAAVTESKRVLHARIVDAYAFVDTKVTLEDGLLYTLIPNKNSTSYNSAKVSIDGRDFGIVNGVIGPESYQPKYTQTAIYLFRENTPVLLMYCASTEQFHAIGRMDIKYIEGFTTWRYPSGNDYVLINKSGTSVTSIKYMRVKSSTKGSEKMFDIQVDDNGTITAVEVTDITTPTG